MNGPATLLTLFLMMVASDARAADRCIITKDQFLRLHAARDFGAPMPMPAKDVQGFLRKFNESPPIVGGEADAVTAVQLPDFPVVRVAFFNGKCLVNTFDMPIPAFMKMFQSSHGMRM